MKALVLADINMQRQQTLPDRFSFHEQIGRDLEDHRVKCWI